jgi:hypothetical protein
VASEVIKPQKPLVTRFAGSKVGQLVVANRKTRRTFGSGFIVLFLVAGTLINQGISRADSNATFIYYIDAPLVQNSYLWTKFKNSPSTHLASFDSIANGGNCSFDNFPGATFSNNAGGRCFTDNSTNWGGATTLSSNPSTGGYTNSSWDNKFMHGVIDHTGATIKFDQPQRYFGIWWSAGSYGNNLKFYSGSQLIGSTSADDVMTRLSDPNSSFTSGAGESFSRDLYYGHPASYSPIEVDDWNQISEITDISLLGSAANFSKGILDPDEPFTYIHFFTDNDTTFDRVVMSAPGNGFEFDNIVVSDETNLLSDTNLNSRLIPQGTVQTPNFSSPPLQEVIFDPNVSQGGSGHPFSQFSDSPQVLANNCDSGDCFTGPNSDYCYAIPHTICPNFIGWNTEPDGSGTQFGTYTDEVYGGQYFDQEVESATYDFASPLTLYAQWSYNFRFFVNPVNHDDYDNWPAPSETTFVNVLAGDSLILPSPAPRVGFTFSGWAIDNFDGEQGPREGDLVIVGQPGDSITPELYTQINYTYFFEIWTAGSTPTSDPSISASLDKIPVDPRLSATALPSFPVDNAVFNLCLAEVADASGSEIVPYSNLTFHFDNSSNTSWTGPINVSSELPITATRSRFVRITVSDPSLQNCNPGKSIVVELSPLQLGGGNTVTVPIGRQ